MTAGTERACYREARVETPIVPADTAAWQRELTTLVANPRLAAATCRDNSHVARAVLSLADVMSDAEDLVRRSACQGVDVLANGEVTPVVLVKASLSRMEEVDPMVNPFGAKGLRFGSRCAFHPRADMYRPRCLALVEWDKRPPRDGTSPDGLSSKFGDVASAFDVYVGHRLYPWPDKPAPGAVGGTTA